MSPVSLALLAGIIALFLTRSVYSFVGPSRVGRDAHAHLLFARDIANNGHRIPDKPSKTVTEGIYAYPYLLHWILSFVPDRWLPTVDRYFSGLLDVLLSLLILSLEPMGVLESHEVLLALIVFIATPEFMRPDLSHGLGISGRKPGVVLTTVSILLFTMWVEFASPLAFLVAVLAGAGVLLTSKFSTQAFFFIVLALSVFVDATGLALLAGSFIVVATLSLGRYLTILKGHLTHLHDYAVAKQFKITNVKPSVSIPRLDDVETISDLLEAGYKNNVVRPLINNLFVIVVGFTYLMIYTSGEQILLPEGFYVWIGAGIGVFLLTSLPYLRFLGQAERYLEYTILPSVALIAKGWTAFGQTYRLVVGLLVIVGIAMVPIFAWAYLNEFSYSERSARFDEVARWLNTKADDVVVVQPIWKGRAVAWNTGHRVVDPILNGGTTKASAKELAQLFPREYGKVTGDVDWLMEQYDPGWVVFETSPGKEYPEPVLRPPDSPPAFENDWFQVYPFEVFCPS